MSVTDTAYLVEEFRRSFGHEPGRGPIFVARAPGRLNLIGEHTDYNDGYVLPMAIDRSIAVVCRRIEKPEVELVSLPTNTRGGASEFPEKASFRLDALRKSKDMPWINYPQGVAWSMQEKGLPLRGLQGVITGDVPLGAGLSSSAAFEVATALAYSAAAALDVDKLQLALMCQRAENEFVGMRCGIMDQYVSLFAHENSALLIDCMTLEHEVVPLPQTGWSVLVCNTGVKHELVATEYNTRRAECEEALKIISAAERGIRTWRDIRPEHLRKYADTLSNRQLRRGRHVVSENQRVLDSVAALKRGDLEEFGRLINASHESLRFDFEVSCAELDAMVDLARKQAGTLGARMVGGGFGGCTVNLVKPDLADRIRESVERGYEKLTGKRPATYLFKAARGAYVETIHE
jgi:galactokinase